jgi:hypothetical protein
VYCVIGTCTVPLAGHIVAGAVVGAFLSSAHGMIAGWGDRDDRRGEGDEGGQQAGVVAFWRGAGLVTHNPRLGAVLII